MRYADVARETENWVDEGLISAPQAERIRARYLETAAGERRGKVVTALAAVGAIVLGLGVILFMAANWSELPKAFRLCLLLGSLVAAYAGGYALAERPGRRPRVGGALYLLGGILFGAALFLVGQMYNVQAHDPLALLIWGLGALAVGATVRSQPLASLGIVVLGAWLMWELADGLGSVDTAGLVPVVAVLYGSGLYGFGTWGRARLNEFALATPMRMAGLGFAALGAFAFSFGFVYEAFEKASTSLSEPGVAVTIVALGAFAGAGTALLALDRTRPTRVWESVALAALSLLAVLAVAAPERAEGSGFENAAVLYPVVFNLLLAALAIGLIVVGYANDEVWLVNTGIAAVAADLVARYFDFFWGLMPRSLAFVGFGLLLLALAFALERQRSRLVRRMRSG